MSNASGDLSFLALKQYYEAKLLVEMIDGVLAEAFQALNDTD